MNFERSSSPKPSLRNTRWHALASVLFLCIQIRSVISWIAPLRFSRQNLLQIQSRSDNEWLSCPGFSRNIYPRRQSPAQIRQDAVADSNTDSSAVSSSSLLPPAISIDNLSCTHNGGETWQVKDVSFVLPQGAKAALIGINGSGKSTLLRILAENTCGDDSFVDTSNEGMVYTGTVSSPRTLKVAYVEQEPPMPSDVSVADAILGIQSFADANKAPSQKASNSVYQIVRRYRIASENAGENPEEFTAATAAMEARNGWSVLTKAEEIATKLRVRHLQDQPLSLLSGGERKRVALASALVQEPDVLLLDEPTNFLSLAGVQWLSDLLTDNPKLTIFMVTHDRAFLDEVCNCVYELDYGSIYQHDGNYADYLEAKDARLASQDAATQAAKAKYRVELEWMRRQPQARQTKAKARIEAFYKLEKATKPLPRDASLSISTDGADRYLGSKILQLRHVSQKFGDRVMLQDFSYDFCAGDRICLVGQNGIGKTTFLRVLSGQQPFDSGERVLGDTVVMGMYDQLGLQMTEQEQREMTVLEFVLQKVQAEQSSSGSTYMAENEARRLLQQFEFPKRRWIERVSMLSGGERRRLQLLEVLSKRPNFLIMDEPSVDCDLDTLSALESYLNEFKGVLIIVSHDRSFADKVTDHLFVFEGEGIVKDYLGTLSEYASCLVEIENDSIPQQSGGTPASTERKENYKEDKAKRNEQRNVLRRAKKDMANTENAIEKLKKKADAIQKEIDSSSDKGWTVLADLTDKLNAVNEEIEESEMRWLELAEVVESDAAEVDV